MNAIATVLLILSFSHVASAANLDRPVCPISVSYRNETRLHTLDPVQRYTELSGLAASPNQLSPDGNVILYGMNDGGGGERLGVWDSVTRELLMSLNVPSSNIVNFDWESMSTGSCGTSGHDEMCIYIADVGDNTGRASAGRRSTRNAANPYRILKIKEPHLPDFEDDDTIPESHISVLPFDYTHPSSPTQYADCEAIFIDHKGWGEGGAAGDLYIITKWGYDERALARVFKIPASAWPTQFNNSVGTMYSPEAVGSYPLVGSSLSVSYWWTRADMTMDGTVISVGDDVASYLFLRCPGATVAEVLASYNTPCYSWLSPSQGQVETFAWMPDGKSNVQIPEGGRPLMGWTTMEYNMQTTTQVCPQVEYNAQGICVSLENNSILPNAWCDTTLSDTNIVTVAPTTAPTASPTSSPTILRTLSPTLSPTNKPSIPIVPSSTPSTSDAVTESPTTAPTTPPTMLRRTLSPTSLPTKAPTPLATSSPQPSDTATVAAGSITSSSTGKRPGLFTRIGQAMATVVFSVVLLL